MTDRDHFAAAALTGLLSNVQRYQNEPLTRQAFEIADFMLRERGKKPEPPDSSTVTEPMPKEKRAGVSDGSKPVAWAVMDGSEFMEFCVDKEEARCAAGYYGDCPIVPLYRRPQPTLTDAEREALHHVVGDVADITGPVEDALRGLLERMK